MVWFSATRAEHVSAVFSSLETELGQVGEMVRLDHEVKLIAPQCTREGPRQEIYDFICGVRAGLPASKYDDKTWAENTDSILQHFMYRFVSRITAVAPGGL